MRKITWVATIVLALVPGVAAFGEVPATPGPGVEQMTGGDRSAADARPGLDMSERLLSRVPTVNLAATKAERNADGLGVFYRKQRQFSAVDYYPVEGFHLSAGFRSWKGRSPKTFQSSDLVGRFSMQSFAPLLPIRASRSNLAPVALAGYQTGIARNTLIGFETGMVSEHGRNWDSGVSGTSSPNHRWAQTGAIAQATMKMRFF